MSSFSSLPYNYFSVLYSLMLWYENCYDWHLQQFRACLGLIVLKIDIYNYCKLNHFDTYKSKQWMYKSDGKNNHGPLAQNFLPFRRGISPLCMLKLVALANYKRKPNCDPSCMELTSYHMGTFNLLLTLTWGDF